MDAVLPSIRLSNGIDHLQRIQRLSGWLVLVCWALVVLLPLAWLWFWMTSDAAQLALQARLPAGVIPLGLAPWQRVVAAAANAVPMACVLLGVWQVKQCFTAFAQGMADIMGQGQALTEENERFV